MSQFGQVNVLPIWYYNLDVVGYIIAHLRSIAESFDTKIASIITRSKNLTKIIKKLIINSRLGVSSYRKGGCVDSCCFSIGQYFQLQLTEHMTVTKRPRGLRVVHVGR